MIEVFLQNSIQLGMHSEFLRGKIGTVVAEGNSVPDVSELVRSTKSFLKILS